MPEHKSSTSQRVFFAVLTVLALASLALAFLIMGSRVHFGDEGRSGVVASAAFSEIPVLTQLPDFEFADQNGKTFGSEQLVGALWIANFIFTSCPTVCPAFTAQMKGLQGRLPKGADKPHLVSFSVDPETDTSAVLKEYAERHGADSAGWSFLTGPIENIRALVVEGFKTSIEPDPSRAGNILHGSHFVLVDEKLRVRGYYGAQDAEAHERLLQDLKRLSREPAN
jgi:protein SCO1